MNAIIVSDLHIGSKYFLYQDFECFLHNIPEDTEFILNGDIVEYPYAKLMPADQQIGSIPLAMARWKMSVAP